MDDPIAKIFYAVSIIYMVVLAVMLIPFVGTITIIGPIIFPLGIIIFTMFNIFLPGIYPELMIVDEKK